MKEKLLSRKLKNGRTLKECLTGIVFTVGIVCCIVTYWIVLYYGTNAIYLRMNWNPGGLTRLLANAMGGMLLWGATMALLGKYFRSQQALFYQPMIDALRRMAKGDFNVAVENKSKNGHFVELVDSINHMAVELGQVEQMRQEFISNVSHEIQSPLTSISGFSRALREGNLTAAERDHYLKIIEAESRRLSKLSDNLLKLTALEARQHPLEMRSYRLDKQLRTVIVLCEPQWQEKELELDIELAPVSVMADEDMLSQVWMNLIHNAIKFSRPAGRLSIRLEMLDQEAAVMITDTGIGMSPEELPRIFERFYKADKSRNRTAGGNGLGLSIVKKIVDMHDGAVTADSVLGAGSVFRVTLPIGEGMAPSQVQRE
jgi:signal transduction histidine kinase